jgi:hypothetical protein
LAWRKDKIFVVEFGAKQGGAPWCLRAALEMTERSRANDRAIRRGCRRKVRGLGL